MPNPYNSASQFEMPAEVTAADIGREFEDVDTVLDLTQDALLVQRCKLFLNAPGLVF